MAEGSGNSVGAASTGATGTGDGATNVAQTPESTTQKTTENVDNKSETTDQKAAEKAEKLSNRDSFRSRISKHYPDSDPNDNEGFYKNANERYGKLSEYKTKHDAINKKMIDTFNSQPAVAGFMRDIMKNVPADIAAARNFDVSSWGKNADDGSFKPEWTEAGEKRQQKLKEKADYLKSIDDNIALTKKEVDSFKTENNLTDEEAGAFLEQVDTFISEAITGKFTKATLGRLYRSITADSEVEAAEVAGRNTAIEAKRTAKNNLVGDGIPDLKGSKTEKPDVIKPKQDRWSAAIDQTIEKRNR